MVATCMCKVFGDSAFKLSKTLLKTDTKIYFTDASNKLGNCGNYCAYVMFDGCLGGNGEVLKITNPIHLGTETYFDIIDRAIDPNACSGAYQAYDHTIQETAYVGDEKSFALYLNDLVTCIDSNAWNCEKTIACLKEGVGITIDPDGTISSLSCADIMNCIKNMSQQNISATKVVGLNCAGDPVLADGFQHWKKTVAPLGTFFDTPGGPGWVGGSIGAAGSYYLKTFAIGTFDISDLPVLCAGEHYEADIYTHMDFNYSDPNTPLPGGAVGYGYSGIQLLVNGTPGYNGSNLSAGTYHIGPAGGYWGPSPFIASRFMLNSGVNTLDITISVSGKSYSAGVDPAVREHKFIQNQIQIMIYKVKD